MTFVIPVEEEETVRNERYAAIALLLIVAVVTVLDIWEDLEHGSQLRHVAMELVVVGGCIIAAVYLWRRILRSLQSRTVQLRKDLEHARADATHWKNNTTTLAKGLTAAIEKQLGEWGLSAAEKEVSFLLIKGLSFREISEVRATSENTVRQQAATIYRKSNLEGRAQLSAFFLEDLFESREISS